MIKYFRPFIRISAFLRKEVMVVLRQPQLLATLVLGPFLILLIFGIGYRNRARELRTLFVVQQGSPIQGEIEQYATSLGPQLVFAGVTSDQEEALRRLRRGEVDLVTVTPVDALQKIQNSEPAVFTLYHREIDPVQVDYVRYFGQVYMNEVNRRVLVSITEQSQSDATSLEKNLEAARNNANNVEQALRQNDPLTAQVMSARLANNVDAISLVLGGSLGLLSGVEQTIGGQSQTNTAELIANLDSIQNDISQLNQTDSGESRQQQIERAQQVESELGDLESQLEQFTRIDPNVLVQPFRSEAKSVAALEPTPVNFYAPAVIALLIQHLVVSLSALSIVRERNVGTTELFRVSPLSAGEILFGKYISFMVFGALITAVLAVLLVYILNVPMLGTWSNFALVMLSLLFTSLGFGFIISLLSNTDTQAVQSTMILLLASVFFSGFLMSLEMLIPAVRVLSWSLPTTYGIVMLRDIFLRGVAPSWIVLGGLTAIGVALAIVAWLLMRRQVSTR